MLKHCNYCNQDRPEDDFHWRNQRLGIRISRCRFCWAEYSKAHYRKNKQMYVDKAWKWNSKKKDEFTVFLLEYFKTHPCVDCGESDPLVLDFDHVRGEKKYNISLIGCGRISREQVLAEIKKCDIRCANCHRRRTAKIGKFRRFRFGNVTTACVPGTNAVQV